MNETVGEKELYGFGLSRQKQEEATGETGSISVALVNNIASKKTTLPSLFKAGSKQALALAEMEVVDKQRLVDRRGKEVYLTFKDMKYIYALSHFLSLIREREDVKSYVSQLSQGLTPDFNIILTIDIVALTKFVEIDGNARKRQKEATIRELDRLANIKQVITLGRKGEKELKYVDSLITIPTKLIDSTTDKSLDIDVVRVQLGYSFFYELYNKYAVIKPELFKLWGKKGSGTDTELFGVLLSDLLGKFSYHRIAAIQAVERIKKKDYKTEDSFFKARSKAERNALTYSETYDTIKQRVTTDYGSTREQKKRFYVDLSRALSTLVELGLITSYSPTDLSKAERLDVVFNKDYTKRSEPSEVEVKTKQQTLQELLS